MRHQFLFVAMPEGKLKGLARDCLKAESCPLHLGMRLEHGEDELQGAQRTKVGKLRLVLAHANLLDIKHIVHEAEKHVKLKDYQVDDLHTLLIVYLAQQVVEEHQGGAQRGSELV